MQRLKVSLVASADTSGGEPESSGDHTRLFNESRTRQMRIGNQSHLRSHYSKIRIRSNRIYPSRYRSSRASGIEETIERCEFKRSWEVPSTLLSSATPRRPEKQIQGALLRRPNDTSDSAACLFASYYEACCDVFVRRQIGSSAVFSNTDE